MSSIRRLISSRANAALSTGPSTEAGKRRSSQNALRHSCRGQSLELLDDRSRHQIDRILHSYISSLQPRNPFELDSMREMSIAQWRMRQLLAIESSMLTEALESQPPGDESDRTADAFLSLLAVPRFALLGRYQSTQDMTFNHALRDLAQSRESAAGRT